MTISIGRIKNFIALSRKLKALFVEAYFYVVISRVLIAVFSFKYLAGYLGETMKESPTDISEKLESTSRAIGKMVKKASLYSPFRALCFEQALAVKFMLNRRNISSTIYFGVATGSDNKLMAHAWTRCGSKYLTGIKGKDIFTKISTFA